jgi:hypothetical protein
MFRAIILPIFMSTRLCVNSLWYNAPTMLPDGSYQPATSWVHCIKSCNTQSSAPEDGRDHRPKHIELTGIINKLLLLHLVGCVYYLYQWCRVKQISTLVAIVPNELPHSLVLMNSQIGFFFTAERWRGINPYTALHNLCFNVILWHKT